MSVSNFSDGQIKTWLIVQVLSDVARLSKKHDITPECAIGYMITSAYNDPMAPKVVIEAMHDACHLIFSDKKIKTQE